MVNLNSLIFGKNDTKHIVSCEVLPSDDESGSMLELFMEKDGRIWNEYRPNKYWLLSSKQFNEHWKPLEGSLHYKYICYFNNKQDLYGAKRKYKDYDLFGVADDKESSMLLNGFTYFKDLKIDEVSRLSWDIETTGLTHDLNSKVLLISNTFTKLGIKNRKLFAYDEYETQADMIDAWCEWVREINPSIILGHNIFMYDFPYMQYVAEKNGTSLKLGRDDSDLRFARYTSKFRKDGSQDYEYTRCWIYGREIIDTLFVAYHFDIGRQYDSYGLKQIIKQEKLEIKDRQFYDAGLIYKNYQDPIEWKKIKLYAEHDADDSDALYNLMIAPFFYLNTHVPKSFQVINYSATGAQLNSFLIRSYLQEGHSIPKGDEITSFKGGLSLGFPGVYKNVIKFDVKSMYPSVMIEYNVCNKKKDPNENFLKMVTFFTDQRLLNKQKAKETKDRYYSDLEQANKQFINSAYGLLGTPGLNFNSSKDASFVTNTSREILIKAIHWATGDKYDRYLSN